MIDSTKCTCCIKSMNKAGSQLEMGMDPASTKVKSQHSLEGSI